MAEIILCINRKMPHPAYQNGDVYHCFNNRRIRWEWATNVICHLDNFGFTRDGLRPPSLALKWYQHTHQYQFSRVGRDEVDRFDTITGVTERYSEKPNAKDKRYIHVQTYIKSRIGHCNHKIFGVPGKEVWYGGRKDFSNAVMDRIWEDIERDTALRETDFLDFPLSAREKQIVVALKIPDVSNAQAELFQSADMIDIIDPVKHVEVEFMRQKRQYYVKYWELPFIDIEKVQDLQTMTDYRENTLPLVAILHKARMLVHG